MAPMQDRAPFRIIVAVAVLAGIIELASSWDFLLDDALIHVRSADLLLQGQVSTVDSSPVFLLLTAAGLRLGASFYVTKLLSLAAFAGLAGVLAVRAWQERQPTLQALLTGFVVLVLSPFGVKWLADGMETSLAVLSVIGLARTLDDDGRGTLRSAARARRPGSDRDRGPGAAGQAQVGGRNHHRPRRRAGGNRRRLRRCMVRRRDRQAAQCLHAAGIRRAAGEYCRRCRHVRRRPVRVLA